MTSSNVRRALVGLVGSAALALSATSQAAAASSPVSVGDASAQPGANVCSWRMATDSVEKTVSFRDGSYTLTSFKNKLTSPAREYVDDGAPSDEFRLTWDGDTVTGASGGWSCVKGDAHQVTAGGAAALQLDVALSRPGLEITKHYLVYPHESLIREWVDYRNTSDVAHRLQQPSFMQQRLMGDEVGHTDLLYMRGGRAVSGAWSLQREQLTPTYSRTFDSYDRFGCSGPSTDGTSGWRDIQHYNPSGYSGRPEWHDGSGGWVWPAAQNPGPSNDTARTWTAPSDGTVDITGHVAMQQFLGDGVVATITKNNQPIWGPKTIAGDDSRGIDANVSGVAVKKDDVIRFVTAPGGNYFYDDVAWDPTIAYAGGDRFQASAGFSDHQGGNGWRFQDATGDGSCPHDSWAETSSVYAPWFSLWNRDQRDGVFMGFDYYGRWAAPIGEQDGDRSSLSLELPNYDSPLPAGKLVTSPKAFAGVYAGDLDDMTNRMLDWQYRYMWDYARKPYVDAVRMLGNWCAGSQWCGAWDQAGTLQKIFGFADHLRTIGADVYHRDNGWWDRPGDWNGPDFKLSHDYLAKSGIGQLIYMMAYNASTGSQVYEQHRDWFDTRSPCGYADWLIDLTNPAAERWMGDLLIGKASQWGDFQWRNDSCPVGPWTGSRQLAQDQAFRRVQQRFLDARPGSAIMGVDSGGNEMTYEFVRMASSFQGSDLGDIGLADGISRLFPTAKFGVMPDAWDPGRCDVGYNALLSFTPDFTGDTSDPSELACMRRLADRFHYLEHEGVAGRWVWQYHPRATDADADWFERVSRDHHRAVVIYKGNGSDSPVTVYPKGLDPDTTYDVRFELADAVSHRSGRDLMDAGIRLDSVRRGEIVWLGMPGHPGAGTDDQAPSAPDAVRAAVATNMGWPGVEVSWKPATDDNWVSAYEVLRDGKPIGTVANGTYYFDHTAEASPGAHYAVRAIDGDGNRGPIGEAPPDPAARVVAVDDDDAAVEYAGAWRHDDGLPESSGGTLSRTLGVCHLACRGFSDTQGANNWRYQDRIGGQWQDIKSYRNSGVNGMREWHDDAPAGGYVWPIGEHPGPSGDTARTWIAPKDGIVDIASHVAKLVTTAGNGVVVRITRNGTTVWGPRTLAGDDLSGFDANVADITVSKGDAIRFEIGNNGDWSSDWTAWDPDITYHGAPPPDETTPTATYTFDGSQVTWLAKLGPDEGVADVAIDGKPDATIDLYAPDDANWAIPVYRKSFGAPGRHTITITATGRHGAHGTGTAVDVDGFRVLSDAPEVAQEDAATVGFSGDGWARHDDARASGGALESSDRAGDSVTFSFRGRQFSWIGHLCPSCGEADVYVDGQFDARVDTFGYRGPDVHRTPVYERSFLGDGPHVVRIVATGRRNLDASAADVAVDAFEVRP